ncbi:MAG TPA: tRNA (adenosine(37)-N6)-threonylcarbamoyltransferase complex dimerization subunit type 1 TsaB [Candidatus Angelobacter sp.]|nr:tRNA (adenosine(37)-N6)-threonylcarbamoyltransferase complex dimerization subunit type 1 TsaB [Candidatus Angelobacter sp.]
MLIFGIDTSGKSGGVTLAEASETTGFGVLASAPIAGGTFSAQLVPTIAALLETSRLGIRDIDGFAAASGPGSFTGLRVGLSAIKGLAEVLHKPIATVSLLEAVAASSPQNGKIIAALDAGRSEVFCGWYQVENGKSTCLNEQLLSSSELIEETKKRDIVLTLTSEPMLKEKLSGVGVEVHLTERPDSSMIARIGASKLIAGQTISVEALDANYLRRSDAEIFFKGSR